MNAVLAICMAAVFAVWVWSLKQELARFENLQSINGTPSHDSPPHSTPIITHQSHHQESRPVRTPVTTPAKHRNADGVPVWVIE
jgi:hypothetical protein